MKSKGKTTSPSRRGEPQKNRLSRPNDHDGRVQCCETAQPPDMGHLAASIVHELRQPLSAIQNLAVYLKSTVSPAEPAVSETLNLLVQQAELAGRILCDLTAFARSGKPRLAAVHLRPLLQDVLNRINWPPEICLKQQLAPRLPRVWADSLHVDRILSNLIANGLESMKGPGTLSIAARAERDEVVLQIADTGCGIQPEVAQNIFQPFVTTKRMGTGLGLALCRQLAEVNGGSILFRNRPGKGTIFEVRLPLASPSWATGKSASRRANSIAGNGKPGRGL